jgi:hypothetical protein
LKLDPYFSPCIKINSKWTFFNERHKTLKLEENIKDTHHDIAQEKTRIDKRNYIKLKSSWTVTEKIIRVKIFVYLAED